MALPDRIYWTRGPNYDVRTEERGDRINYAAHPKGSAPAWPRAEVWDFDPVSGVETEARS